MTTRTVKVKRISESLPCKLKDSERLNFADDLAEATRSVEIAKNNKDSAMKSFNYDIKIAEARRDRLAGVVGSKTEYREVTVEERWDWDKDKYTRVRTDTGEQIFERRLTDKEKQTEMLEIEDLGGSED